MREIPETIEHGCNAFWRATLLLSADELGVFAALAEGPATAAAVQVRLGLDRESAADFLAALVPLGVLEDHGGRYSLSDHVTHLLEPAQPTYIGAWLAMARAALHEASTLAELAAILDADCAH